ncbi:MAG TPA: tetratricopeptide repeat protein, partial [Ideonella sp.]|nr:tetratricopeptide repeat protein [Ideonella sp.]
MSLQRALLMTDVVDSTRVSEALGDAATATLWAAHDRAARDLLQRWHGREIDKTDGLLALFDSAVDAAGYALAYHRALAALEPPLAARAGIDFGPVILRENAAADVALGAKPIEVEGLAKAIVARIMPIARGGQTLLSARAREALGDAPPGRLHSQGHWRLKGIAEPVELFEAADADAPFLPPPDGGPKAYRVVRHGELWLPADPVRHNLPAERDVFVDRQTTLAELARRFEQGARLVSILGIGGTGKTRLATRFAWSWLGDFPGGIWFCDLSAARDVDGIVRAVADALDVPLGRDDAVTQLGHAIAGRGRCLIVLDNFEQVARHAQDTLGRWLDRAGDACFVVTTREVLGLAGEAALALAPLPLDEAAALFVRRAQAARADFAPTDDDRQAIATLARLLDGLPLAIELAAARVRVMPLRTLLARMHERFRLLASGGGRRDRQATLRAAFDWSWDLLSAADRAALAQLSVFEGGFTLEAAEAVLDLSAVDAAAWPLDAVQSLVDKSLVRPLAGARLGLLTSVQEYAAEHLRTEGRYPGSGARALEATEARHGAWFAAFDEARAIADGGVELDNLVAACRRAIPRGAAATAVGALEGAAAAIRLRGPFRLGVELAQEVLAMPLLDPPRRAAALRIAGNLLQRVGEPAPARERFESALELASGAGAARGAAEALFALGALDGNEGRREPARSRLTQALAQARALGTGALECDALNHLATLLELEGRTEEARTHHEAALAAARSLGDRRREGGQLGNIGVLLAGQGRLDEAATAIEASMLIAREVGDRQWEGNGRCNLGLLQHMRGHMSEARDQLAAALAIARDLGHVRLEWVARCNLGIVHEALGEAEAAATDYEAALRLARDAGDRRGEGQVLNYLGALHVRQARLDDARACLDAGEALLREVGDRLTLGLLLCSRAEVEHLSGRRDIAATALGQAESICTEMGTGADSELGQ